MSDSTQLASKCIESAKGLLHMIVDDDKAHVGQLKHQDKDVTAGDALQSTTKLLAAVNEACLQLKVDLKKCKEKKIDRKSDEGCEINMILKALPLLQAENARLKGVDADAKLDDRYFPVNGDSNPMVGKLKKLIEQHQGGAAAESTVEESSVSTVEESAPEKSVESTSSSVTVEKPVQAESTSEKASESSQPVQSTESTEESSVKSVEESSGSPVEESSATSAEESTAKPAESTDESAAPSTEKPVEESTEESSSGSSTAKPVEESTEESSSGSSTAKPVEESTAKPVEESTEESSSSSSTSSSSTASSSETVHDLMVEAAAIMAEDAPSVKAAADYSAMTAEQLFKEAKKFKTHAQKDQFIALLIEHLAVSKAGGGSEKESATPDIVVEEVILTATPVGKTFIVEDVSKFTRKRGGVVEVLVKWKGFGPDEMTWEIRTDELSRANVAGDYFQSGDTSYKKYCERVGGCKSLEEKDCKKRNKAKGKKEDEPCSDVEESAEFAEIPTPTFSDDEGKEEALVTSASE